MKFLSMLIGVFLLTVLVVTGAPRAAFADKEQFIEAKCTKCHSISALGVEKKDSGDDEEEEDDDEGTEPPDLSHVGKDHDAGFFVAYLAKKETHVPHGDVKSTKKHKVKFKGSEADLKKMADWLVTLK